MSQPTSDQFPVLPESLEQCDLDSPEFWQEPTDDELAALEAEQAADDEPADTGIIVLDRCDTCDKLRDLVDGVCAECGHDISEAVAA